MCNGTCVVNHELFRNEMNEHGMPTRCSFFVGLRFRRAVDRAAFQRVYIAKDRRHARIPKGPKLFPSPPLQVKSQVKSSQVFSENKPNKANSIQVKVNSVNTPKEIKSNQVEGGEGGQAMRGTTYCSKNSERLTVICHLDLKMCHKFWFGTSGRFWRIKI